MGQQILKYLVVAVILAFLINLPYVVMQAATHCEIKLAWGKYVDVTNEPWAKDWVKGCREPVHIQKTDFGTGFGTFSVRRPNE